MQKYRLKIPAKYAHIVCPELKTLQNEPLEAGPSSNGQTLICSWYIPTDWLEPIEDGQVSAEEWVENKYPKITRCFTYDPTGKIVEYLISSFQAGETNDRKRTQPLINAVAMYIRGMGRDDEAYSEMQQALKTLEENER